MAYTVKKRREEQGWLGRNYSLCKGPVEGGSLQHSFEETEDLLEGMLGISKYHVVLSRTI